MAVMAGQRTNRSCQLCVGNSTASAIRAAILMAFHRYTVHRPCIHSGGLCIFCFTSMCSERVPLAFGRALAVWCKVLIESNSLEAYPTGRQADTRRKQAIINLHLAFCVHSFVTSTSTAIAARAPARTLNTGMYGVSWLMVGMLVL